MTAPVSAVCVKMKANYMTNPSNRPSLRSPSAPLFPLGDVAVTPGALSLLERYQVNPLLLLGLHLQGNWGIVSDEARGANDDAVQRGHRIVSSYNVGESDRVVVITAHDRSSTYIKLPSEA